MACAAVGGIACAVIIAFGVAALGLVPYPVLAIAITLNNSVIGTIVAAILLPILYPLARSFGLLYTDIMEPSEYRSGKIAWSGMILTTAGAVFGLLVAISVSIAGQVSGGGEPGGTGLSDPQVLAGGISVLAILIGSVLMSPLGGRPAGEQSIEADLLGREDA